MQFKERLSCEDNFALHFFFFREDDKRLRIQDVYLYCYYVRWERRSIMVMKFHK